MQYIYNRIIYGDTKLITNVVLGIVKDIRPIVDEELCFDIRLILSELLINCHEHGNKYDKNKCIKLNISIDRNSVNIEVEDEGEGIKNFKKYDVKERRPDGRGLLIVKSLVDKIVIDKNMVKCNINLTS